jgi:hypothetical protein
MNHIIYRKNITYIQGQTIDNIYNQFIFTDKQSKNTTQYMLDTIMRK